MAFTYTITAGDWGHIAPQLTLLGVALLVMVIDTMLPARLRGGLVIIALLGVLSAAASALLVAQLGGAPSAFFGMITSDGLAIFSMLVILGATALALLIAPGYIERQGIHQQGEYYALVLLAATGMLLMSTASNLMMIFLGLELLSLPLYVLCAFVPGQQIAQESGMKYFLLSSFASGFLLYGMALVYGATGATGLTQIHAFVASHMPLDSSLAPLLLVGVVLIVVGLAFKVSAIPFHAWTPDVYQGAPTPVTALMSVGTKTAALVALARILVVALGPITSQWQPLLIALAILTMLGGNLLAATQTNVKRMLAYSSIAHAGYLLIGIAVGTNLGLAAMIFYLAAYGIMNIGAFGVVQVIERSVGFGTELDRFRGLGARQPWLAGAMTVFLLALAGIPGTVGFVAKYAVFSAAVLASHPELTIVGVIASMISFYYYLRIIWAMYFELNPEGDPATQGARAALGAQGTPPLMVESSGQSAVIAAKSVSMRQPIALGAMLSLGLAVLATIILGILPGPLFELARQAVGLP